MNIVWWIVIVMVVAFISMVATVFLCRRLHFEHREHKRNLLIKELFRMSWSELKQKGFFDSQKFFRETACAVRLVGFSLSDFFIRPDDIEQIEKSGSDRLCREILECFENFFDTHELVQSVEFFGFYDIIEHGGPNERTFADLEIILRERLEDVGKTLADFGEDEDSLSCYRDWWKTYGLLYPDHLLDSKLV